MADSHNDFGKGSLHSSAPQNAAKQNKNTGNKGVSLGNLSSSVVE